MARQFHSETARRNAKARERRNKKVHALFGLIGNKAEVARRMNMSRQHVSKVLKEMADDQASGA